MSFAMRLTRPASTLPGPISSAWVTPCVGHELDARLPAHGAVDLADEQLLRRGRRRCWAAASKLATTGKRGRADVDAGELALRRRAPPGAMSAQWKGALTLSGMARPFSAATSSPTRATAPAWPAMTICPGALKFAGRDDLALRGLAAERLEPRRLEAHDGRHRAGARRDGLLHRAAARAHEAHRVLERRAPRPRRARSTRRASDPRRRRAAARSGTRSRIAARMAQLVATMRGLGVRGEGELLLGALEDEPREALAERGVGALEHGARGGRDRRARPGPCRPPASPCPGNSHATLMVCAGRL